MRKTLEYRLYLFRTSNVLPKFWDKRCNYGSSKRKQTARKYYRREAQVWFFMFDDNERRKWKYSRKKNRSTMIRTKYYFGPFAVGKFHEFRQCLTNLLENLEMIHVVFSQNFLSRKSVKSLKISLSPQVYCIDGILRHTHYGYCYNDYALNCCFKIQPGGSRKGFDCLSTFGIYLYFFLLSICVFLGLTSSMVCPAFLF